MGISLLPVRAPVPQSKVTRSLGQRSVTNPLILDTQVSLIINPNPDPDLKEDDSEDDGEADAGHGPDHSHIQGDSHHLGGVVIIHIGVAGLGPSSTNSLHPEDDH